MNFLLPALFWLPCLPDSPLFLRCFFVPVNSLLPGLPALGLRREEAQAVVFLLPPPSASPSPAETLLAFIPYPERSAPVASFSHPIPPPPTIPPPPKTRLSFRALIPSGSSKLPSTPALPTSGSPGPLSPSVLLPRSWGFAFLPLSCSPARRSFSKWIRREHELDRLESVPGNLGSVKPGITCPINARSVRSSKLPVTSGVGTVWGGVSCPPRAPGEAVQRGRAVCTQLEPPGYYVPALEQTAEAARTGEPLKNTASITPALIFFWLHWVLVGT